MKQKSLRCMLKVQSARKGEADAERQLKKTRKVEVDYRNSVARNQKLIKELYLKCATVKELYKEIDNLKGCGNKRICTGSQTDEWSSKERMLKHDLENEQHSVQILRDELAVANDKIMEFTQLQAERAQDGLPTNQIISVNT